MSLLHKLGAQLSELSPENVDREVSHLRTKAGRERFGEDMFSYVSPLNVSLDEASGARASYQYMQVLEVLKCYLEWCTASFTGYHTDSDSMLKSVFDGTAFRVHDYFCGDHQKLCIHLYTDEFEVCNPIGAQKQKHKLMAVYYTVFNVPAHLRTHVAHIHLALICKEKYIEKYGMDKVLELLHRDVESLETEGISVNGRNVKGRVLCLSGDNLSSHRIGGFKASFNHGHICRFCMALHSDISSKHREQDFVLRTPSLHHYHLDMLKGGVATLPLFGIKAPSALHFSGFHPTEHLPPDIMHDLHEGVLPFVLRHVIANLISKRFFSLDELNERIRNFAYDKCDAKNKPESVSPKFLSSGGVMRGSASQKFCLFRNLTLYIGNRIPNDDEGLAVVPFTP
ncbi:uncharacterized protein LOC135389196 [Ornithodoros turicata]|uniref:uncharacterized protein LOC135389196 n=1 Tax=Ornithodoros turicata TaxID=34597 RepID=UPI003139185C